MPNNKMMAVAVTILETMMKVFPQEHLDFMFCGLLDPGDVVECNLRRPAVADAFFNGRPALMNGC